MGITTLSKVLDAEQMANIKSATLIGESSSAGEVTLSESIENFVFIEIVRKTASDVYSSPFVVTPAMLKNSSYDSGKGYGIVSYNTSNSSIVLTKIWYVSDTKISVRDGCYIYGVIKKQ